MHPLERWALWRRLRRLQRAGRLVRIEAEGVSDTMACRILRAGILSLDIELWADDGAGPEPWGEAWLPLGAIRYVESYHRGLAKDMAYLGWGAGAAGDPEGLPAPGGR